MNTSSMAEVSCRYRVTPYLHFPFLASQWQSPMSNENHSFAHNKPGRDSVVIVNHMHELYSVARKEEPNVIDICHFAFTYDMMYGNIFVH
ncbi:hypothetical protein DM02DRAFT_704679 [Periconia macrospinosa]|uniref:Uncharacterized protein n=1 Tax=Periconia macrospinosa TaxID=97972 RepID=A0A2V1DWC1_9PLEO|nr:hypothetical protein DM02DRAFT_704679 [Periconia macrospinosa]